MNKEHRKDPQALKFILTDADKEETHKYPGMFLFGHRHIMLLMCSFGF